MSNPISAGVIGWPVAHSLSPRLHRHWLDHYGIAGHYLPLPVRREDFSFALRGLRRAGFAGVNVTLPQKEAAFSVAHALDEAARATGAVNLLLFQPDGRLLGRNTDVEGLIATLRESGISFTGRPAVVLGAGGAARAAVLALAAFGLPEIRILCRDAKQGEDLIASLPKKNLPPVREFLWPKWPNAAQDIGCLINASSGGLAGGTALELSLDPLPRTVLVCDLVYKPLETDLLRRACARGNPTADGLSMLLHQAVPSFEALYGVRPTVTPSLRKMLEVTLRGDG